MIDDGHRVIVMVSGNGTGLGSVNIISDPIIIQGILEKEKEKEDELIQSLKDFKPYEETKEDFEPKRNKKGKKLKNWQTTNGWR